ncbi:MAG TPA: type II toxin-antitoxin system RelE/ParE family toxin [Alphaproteobacteria bacterium]|nr:type II toxin-antitoxin system RelE/ParE family toxin [Alphaproteobacteria bacterium]
MRVFKTKSFRRFQRKEGIDDAALCEAIWRAEHGLVDADLGHGLIKQRLARPGEGRRGGYRTVVAYRTGERAVFLFGFAKSDQSNLSMADVRDLKDYGALLLALDTRGIEAMIAGRELTEVAYDEEA